MCVFYHQWCFDQRNLHEIHRNLNNSKSNSSKPIPRRQNIVQNHVFNVSILSFLCRALWCDQTKGPSDLVPQSDVLKLLPLFQVGWFVICFGVGLLIICCHSFKLVFSSRLFVVEFSRTNKAVVLGVWHDSFEIFVRVRTNEQFSWPIFASPELEF